LPDSPHAAVLGLCKIFAKLKIGTFKKRIKAEDDRIIVMFYTET